MSKCHCKADARVATWPKCWALHATGHALSVFGIAANNLIAEHVGAKLIKLEVKLLKRPRLAMAAEVGSTEKALQAVGCLCESLKA